MQLAWELVSTIEIEEHPVSAPEADAGRNQRDGIQPSRRWTIPGSAIIAVAALAVLAIWFAVGYQNGDAPERHLQTDVAEISPAALQALARTLGHPIYWLGTRRNATYELATTSDGKLYLRYLAPGVRLGDPRGSLTVAMYPMQDPVATIEALKRQAGALPISIAGGVGVYWPTQPNHLYAAFPGVDYQIEVYAPTPLLAQRLVAGGQLRAAGAPAP